MSTGMKGFGLLETPQHLLAKLRYDFSRMQEGPEDQYAAFDFFVTAEHMVDWVQPGYTNRAARATLRTSSPLLEVVSHIASGSKHFVAEARQHRHVQHLDVPMMLDSEVDNACGFQELFVTLDGTAAQDIGHKLRIVDLAERVLYFWEDYIQHRYN